jgi:P27 family predicted phage terminase small subunit
MLADSGVLAVADLPALAMLCAAWSDWHEARETIARQGSVAKGSRGQPRPHPMLARLDRARDDFLRGAEAFGLTPTGRARLSAAGFQAPREDLQTMLARELGQVLNGSEQ